MTELWGYLLATAISMSISIGLIFGFYAYLMRRLRAQDTIHEAEQRRHWIELEASVDAEWAKMRARGVDVDGVLRQVRGQRPATAAVESDRQ